MSSEEGRETGYASPLLVWNRTTTAAQQFAGETAGAEAVPSIVHFASAALVFSVLANDAAADAVSDDRCTIAGWGVWDLGEDPAASAALKLIGNLWVRVQPTDAGVPVVLSPTS